MFIHDNFEIDDFSKEKHRKFDVCIHFKGDKVYEITGFLEACGFGEGKGGIFRGLVWTSYMYGP